MILNSNGENVWFVPVILRSFCQVDIEYFPFDEQTCILRFGSWTYHGLELDFNLLNDSVDLSKYKSSGEFELVTVTAKREVLEYRYVSTLFALWAKQFYVVSNGSTLFNVVGAESLGVFTENA